MGIWVRVTDEVLTAACSLENQIVTWLGLQRTFESSTAVSDDDLLLDVFDELIRAGDKRLSQFDWILEVLTLELGDVYLCFDVALVVKGLAQAALEDIARVW